ncbi:MAG: chorismate synthase [Candidatus Hydrogenedens sp.]|nr:chorismate synthase [Candidatus Hydrogenedens sp.]
MGPKGAGKSTVGRLFAEAVGLPVLDTDALVEERDGQGRTCREIFIQEGAEAFRTLEREVAIETGAKDYCVVITGAGLMMDPESRAAMRPRAVLVYLSADTDTLWQRATENGLPPWLEGPDGRAKYDAQTAHRNEVLRPFADILLDTTGQTPEDLAELLVERVGQELGIRMQAANTYGDVIRMTSFGESHGLALGIVVDGMRPGLEYSEAVIMEQMNRRKPGQSKVVTQRKEPDEVKILSGVFEGKTTGAPIAMVIYNQDQRSKNYDDIKDVFRPGHGDFTFYRKYGIRDYRGGGRQSARETAGRVAAGAVPMHLLAQKGVRIVAHAIEVAGIRAETCDFATIEDNPVRCADPVAAKKMEQAILDARSAKDSVGGIVQLEIHGLPVGLGDPIFGKLDARLISAIMTVGAFKGVEVGTGFDLVRMRGSEANDPMAGGQFTSNHQGGILGGISTGQPVILRIAVKPTASIAQQQHTNDEAGRERDIAVLGRHDPCIVPRAVPVIENMAAFVVFDAWEVQARLNPEWEEKYGSW